MASEVRQYRPNWELRREIAAAAGVEIARYAAGGQHGFTKDDLYAVAECHGDPPDDLTLAELYRWVCGECGTEYNETAGNQWRLGRTQLLAIHERVVIEGGDSDGE